MENWTYVEELRSRFGRRHSTPRQRAAHDRDVARMLSPWRAHQRPPGSRLE